MIYRNSVEMTCDGQVAFELHNNDMVLSFIDHFIRSEGERSSFPVMLEVQNCSFAV